MKTFKEWLNENDDITIQENILIDISKQLSRKYLLPTATIFAILSGNGCVNKKECPTPQIQQAIIQDAQEIDTSNQDVQKTPQIQTFKQDVKKVNPIKQDNPQKQNPMEKINNIIKTTQGSEGWNDKFGNFTAYITNDGIIYHSEDKNYYLITPEDNKRFTKTFRKLDINTGNWGQPTVISDYMMSRKK